MITPGGKKIHQLKETLLMYDITPASYSDPLNATKISLGDVQASKK